ncbi:MAG: ATP-binding protein [Ginsengibacter sp.]
MSASITPSSSFRHIMDLFKNAKQNSILLLDTYGTILALNQAVTHHFGYTEKDITGKNFAVLFTTEDQKKGLPEREIERVLQTGQSNDNNYLISKDNLATWVSGESLLIEHGKDSHLILKVVENIHVQKAAEISLKVLNNFNENVLATIRDAVIVLDEKMTVIKANDAFLKLARKEESGFPDLNFIEFLKQYDPNNRLTNGLQQAIKLQAGFSNKEIEIETMPGNKKVFEVTCTPLINSRNNRFLLVIHDVTIAKEIEKEREDTLGFVTHELRNPLTNLLLSNELMTEAIRENDLSEVKMILARFERSVQRMNKMISGLSESTKIHSGIFELETSEFDFGKMIKDAIEVTQALEPSFHITVKGDAGFSIVADRYRLIQVITNYLSNAIKYSNGNKEITLKVSHNKQSATVAVNDKGIGISKESLPYIFERFFRVKKTRKIEGIGLGLYLCKQIIHAHKGDVWVESEENKGTTFYFSIPCLPVTNQSQ